MTKEIINSIDRALDILMFLYHKQEETGITEIGKSLGLHKSTVHRTLITLENKGFVRQNPENGKYWLGIKLYTLGTLVGEKMSLKNIVKPYARELSRKFSEVVNVSVLDITDEGIPKTILILKEEIPNQMLKVNPPEGSMSESHYSAVGKCILAHSSEEILDRFRNFEFPTYTQNTIQSWEQLKETLDKIREVGYAVDDEEIELGLTCIAVPILDRKRKALAAISISGPTSRINSHEFEDLLKGLKTTARKIADLLT